MVYYNLMEGDSNTGKLLYSELLVRIELMTL